MSQEPGVEHFINYNNCSFLIYYVIIINKLNFLEIIIDFNPNIIVTFKKNKKPTSGGCGTFKKNLKIK